MQHVDGARLFWKKKSLNNQHNETAEKQIRHHTWIFGNFQRGDIAEVEFDRENDTSVVPRIFENREAAEREIAEGRKKEDVIRALFATLEIKGRYRDKEVFAAAVSEIAEKAKVKGLAPIRNTAFAPLGERDQNAEMCRDNKERPDSDCKLRNTENIPLPRGTKLPLPMDFVPDKPNGKTVQAFRVEINAYIANLEEDIAGLLKELMA